MSGPFLLVTQGRAVCCSVVCWEETPPAGLTCVSLDGRLVCMLNPVVPRPTPNCAEGACPDCGDDVTIAWADFYDTSFSVSRCSCFGSSERDARVLPMSARGSFSRSVVTDHLRAVAR